MRQQINLYQPTLSGERKRFSAGRAAAVFALAIAGMAAYSMQARTRIATLDEQVATLRVEKEAHDAAAAELGEQHAAAGQPAQIESRIKQLLRAVDARKRAVDMLQAGAAGETTGFAARMEALARGHIDGLWLDGVKLSGTAGFMNLTGATLDADTVPLYLQSLARDPALKGTRFDDFVIVRPTTLKNALDDESAAAEDGGDKPAPKPAQQFTRFKIATHALANPKAEDAS